MIQRPSEFIAFLRRRTDPETVTHYRGVDELDFLIAFIGGGLRLDDLENQTYLRFPASRGASATTGDNDTATQGLLASHTDPLDAWYRYKHGKRSEPAARPELRIDPRCREVIDALAKRREPGWLSIGAILVDQDVASQERIIGRINDACGCRKLCRWWSGGISVLVDESATAGRSNDLEVSVWLVCSVGGDGWSLIE